MKWNRIIGLIGIGLISFFTALLGDINAWLICVDSVIATMIYFYYYIPNKKERGK